MDLQAEMVQGTCREAVEERVVAARRAFVGCYAAVCVRCSAVQCGVGDRGQSLADIVWV